MRCICQPARKVVVKEIKKGLWLSILSVSLLSLSVCVCRENVPSWKNWPGPQRDRKSEEEAEAKLKCDMNIMSYLLWPAVQPADGYIAIKKSWQRLYNSVDAFYNRPINNSSGRPVSSLKISRFIRDDDPRCCPFRNPPLKYQSQHLFLLSFLWPKCVTIPREYQV